MKVAPYSGHYALKKGFAPQNVIPMCGIASYFRGESVISESEMWWGPRIWFCMHSCSTPTHMRTLTHTHREGGLYFFFKSGLACDYSRINSRNTKGNQAGKEISYLQGLH